MLKKRLIFTLIYCDGFFMQSRNFRLQRVGDIYWLKKNYQFQKISFSLDELIVLNASREKKDITDFSKIVIQLAQHVFIPLAAGGGIRSLQDAEILFKHGADKLVLNSALHSSPNLVKALVNKYGSQSIVASIDYKKNDGIEKILINNGSTEIDLSLHDYLIHLETLQVGEIYLNSINQDGTGFGYDVETIHRVKNYIHIPFIIAGGAGNERHLLEGLGISNISAVATANLFNFIGNGLPNARKNIIFHGIDIADWKNFCNT